jgi:tetratricopeptide (TPR) repeat protein
MDNGDFLGGKAAQQEALSIYEEALGDGDPRVVYTQRDLGAILRQEGRFAEVEQLYRTALSAARRRNDVAWIGDDLMDLGTVLLAQGRYAEAEPVLREALAVREKTLPTPWWGTYDAMSTLGVAIAGQGRFAEAEPLLVEGFEGLQRDPKSWGWRPAAVQRLVRLYEAWEQAEPGKGYLAKADIWEQRLAALGATTAANSPPEVSSTDDAVEDASSPPVAR